MVISYTTRRDVAEVRQRLAWASWWRWGFSHTTGTRFCDVAGVRAIVALIGAEDIMMLYRVSMPPALSSGPPGHPAPQIAEIDVS